MESLSKKEIINKTIKQLYRSEWATDDGSIYVCKVYIELEDGAVFELQCYDEDEVQPIEKINVDSVELYLLERDIRQQCRGKKIRDVVVSDMWPCIGLLLEDDNVLFIDVWGETVGPVVLNRQTSDHNFKYLIDEMESYWKEK